jgi:hypothetical protein
MENTLLMEAKKGIISSLKQYVSKQASNLKEKYKMPKSPDHPDVLKQQIEDLGKKYALAIMQIYSIKPEPATVKIFEREGFVLELLQVVREHGYEKDSKDNEDPKGNENLKDNKDPDERLKSNKNLNRLQTFMAHHIQDGVKDIVTNQTSVQQPLTYIKKHVFDFFDISDTSAGPEAKLRAGLQNAVVERVKGDIQEAALKEYQVLSQKEELRNFFYVLVTTEIFRKMKIMELVLEKKDSEGKKEEDTQKSL